MKRVPSILSVPLRALARRDFVEARVAIDIVPRRRDVAWVVAAFALTPAELGFARALGEFGSVVVVAGNLLHPDDAGVVGRGEIEVGHSDVDVSQSQDAAWASGLGWQRGSS